MGYVSRWIASQQKLPQATAGESSNSEDLLACSPSFRDSEKQVFGCEHYSRNCKLRAACCGKLFTCRFCHDKISDHSMDRYICAIYYCLLDYQWTSMYYFLILNYLQEGYN